MRKLFLIISILLLPVSFLFSQNPEWINYTTGLYVNDIKEDGDFLWVAHSGGLTRFNKTTEEMIFFNRGTGVPATNRLNSVAVQSSNIWVGMNTSDIRGIKAIAQYDYENWYYYDYYNSELPRKHIYCIATENDTTIWIGMDDYIIKIQGNEWTLFDEDTIGIDFVGVRSLIITPDGTKWFTGNARLIKFNNFEWEEFSTLNSGIESGDVTALEIDTDNYIWFTVRKWASYHGGLGCFDTETEEWTGYTMANSGLPSEELYDIAIDAQGNKWIATADTGLVKFDEENWTVWHTGNSNIPGNNVTDILVDSDGIKWLAVQDYGLVKFDDESFTSYNVSNSILSYHWITCVHCNENGAWIGVGSISNPMGVAHYQNSEWSLYNMSNSNLPSNRILSFDTDSYGHIWAATTDADNSEGGIACFDGNEWTYYNYYNSILPYNNFLSIKIDTNNVKWLGADGEGLIMFDEQAQICEVYKTYNSGIPGNHVSDLDFDNEGNIWLGTCYNGIARFDKEDEWIIYNTSNSNIPSNEISCILVDNEENIWVGTEGDCLGKFDGSSWHIYGYSYGLEKINDIALASDGSVWVAGFRYPSATEGGLVKIDGDVVTVYDMGNSLLPDTRTSALFFDTNDNLWIGTWLEYVAVFNEGGIVSVDENEEITDITFSLFNYPNPFSSSTTISFNLATKSHKNAQIEIYNIKGQLVKNFELRTPPVLRRSSASEDGNSEFTKVVWNGKDDNGKSVSSGIYLYRLSSGDESCTRKMILMK